MESGGISLILEKEHTSKEYAGHYFETESEMAGLFRLDTAILNSLIVQGSVFDAMMGPGRHVVHLARRGLPVHGNDFNRHMVDIAGKQLKKEKLKANLTNYDVTDLSAIKSGSFGTIICMYNALGSIMGSDKRQAAVSEMARVCKSGGRAIFHMHNLLGDLSNWDDIRNLIENFLARPKGLGGGDFVAHDKYLGNTFQHFFTTGEVSEMFSKAGLSVEKKIFLRGWRQDRITHSPLREFLSGGFIFVGKKV